MDIKKLKLEGKRIFIRTDYNVVLSSQGEILDDTRIKRGLATVKWCSNQGGRVIIATHLGYPGGKIDSNLSTQLLVKNIEQNLKQKIRFVNDCVGESVKDAITSLKNGEVLLLENLRFYMGELDNDEGFARKLIMGYDIFINDAFSVSHRNHASVNAINKFANKSYFGLSLTKELSVLTNTLSRSKKSIAIIGGGWKATQKIEVVENLAKNMHFILIGGALAQIFYIAKGISLNNSIEIPTEKIKLATSILENYNNIILPVDNLTLVDKKIKNIKHSDIEQNMQLLDIGIETLLVFKAIISKAEVVFWNGPLGKYEDPLFENGTKEIATHISNLQDVEGVICGGDTLAAINDFGLSKRYSYLSSAGGAALNFLAGKNMPGFENINTDII
ncbi:phosphoglycerate kinase [Candidatus Babeliales bacterium]|nr:phosphoglycerate kinase [Candidatus Babeliales bacterium]